MKVGIAVVPDKGKSVILIDFKAVMVLDCIIPENKVADIIFALEEYLKAQNKAEAV